MKMFTIVDGKFYIIVENKVLVRECDFCAFGNEGCPIDECPDNTYLKEAEYINGEVVELPTFEKGEIVEVSDSLPWPKYPALRRFHSKADYQGGNGYRMIDRNGDGGAVWKYAQKVKPYKD